MTDWGCPGAGKCHGCLCWCERCGDVGEVCDASGCVVHRCLRCDRILTDEQKAFERDHWMWCFDCSVAVAMEKALACGHDEVAAGEQRRREIDLHRWLVSGVPIPDP